MDEQWVNKWLEILGLSLNKAGDLFKPFEPSRDFYDALLSGEDHDLEVGAEHVGRHLGLAAVPSAAYEWGLKMKPEVAGQIKLADDRRNAIQIPLSSIGKPYFLGAILAHELTHDLLYCSGITCPNLEELERLTDLAAIAVGLGKLILNGIITELLPGTGQAVTLGYLSPDLTAYAFKVVNKRHLVSDADARKNLAAEALKMLDIHSLQTRTEERRDVENKKKRITKSFSGFFKRGKKRHV